MDIKTILACLRLKLNLPLRSNTFFTSFVRYKKEKVRAMAEKTFEGIPRNKIHWDPIIDYEKCTTCGACVDFCHVDALKFKEKDGKKRTVVNPNKCIVFCTGCHPVCPEGAITHPSEESTLKIINELKKTTN